MRPYNLLSLTTALIGVSYAAPAPQEADVSAAATNKVKISLGTVVGSVVDGVEYYRGIPYAQPPTGLLRLRPPVRALNFGTIQATGLGPACPQITDAEESSLFFQVLGEPGVMNTLFYGMAQGDVKEDCLTVSVMRPEGTKSGDKLPVLFWIHGGGYQFGSSQPFNASVLVPRAVSQDKPFIFVGINYRLGGFGFLGGAEVKAEGAANLGLLDQRMALEWVADNIAAFGGDPNAVTIWGESAGAMSVFDQMALYNGNNSYKGKKLFRGAIMNSGSLTPTQPVDGAKAQQIFDTVAEAAGCGSVSSLLKLSCLRKVDYETFALATTKAPTMLGYNSLALSYTPRPDGRVLTASPEVLAQTGKYAAVPLIIGNQKNEGTVFSLWQTNVTTKAELVSYLNEIFFQSATREEVAGLVDTYPDPTNTPAGAYPEYERLAAILGDWVFTLVSRILLDTVPKSVPAWSYLSAYADDTPLIGTYHTSDLPRILVQTDKVSTAIQDLYIAFVNSLDPNNGASAGGYAVNWPKWQEGKQLLEFGADSTRVLNFDFRAASLDYIRTNSESLRL